MHMAKAASKETASPQERVSGRGERSGERLRCPFPSLTPVAETYRQGGDSR